MTMKYSQKGIGAINMKRWIPGYENKYFATESGRIFRHSKNGKHRELKGYQKRTNYVVKLTIDDKTKEHAFNRIIWQTFNGEIPKGYVVDRKIKNLRNNQLSNLECVSRAKSGERTGGMSKSKPVEMLDENGEVIDWWKSARKAAIDLHCSYQTIMDICNKKVKKPMFNIRWERVHRKNIA